MQLSRVGLLTVNRFRVREGPPVSLFLLAGLVGFVFGVTLGLLL